MPLQGLDGTLWSHECSLLDESFHGGDLRAWSLRFYPKGGITNDGSQDVDERKDPDIGLVSRTAVNLKPIGMIPPPFWSRVVSPTQYSIV
mmetsp:Transcript_10184/g.20557  ORF Transcript_10184/g.20557 Transcript_10184/m.20557 type:complete len:90 (-) Transcript_10184:276-545(-)